MEQFIIWLYTGEEKKVYAKSIQEAMKILDLVETEIEDYTCASELEMA
tara:strand:- start:582 stop:725 length:144 start_codon:yes stop_codon:yes gene_type:complete